MMEVIKESVKQTDLNALEEIADIFFPATPYTPAQEELWNWFMFALSAKGITIKTLQANEFAQFSDQLTKLTKAIYAQTRLQQTAVEKKEAEPD
ncbi:hypothetical protein [Mucilaginibacter arboris]|uniref:Uncharacterized protein n=1 Tax=Mucilaginibacter arboris TaxID=2682090 RepID=A0A7K1SVJ2_9SPHI|nr:hypothetical protein [Mucilaginibacter arboris]MVN21257.1 hypothetical protein [Mucilaginibacter arboris]